jgi:hypothetical protein
MLDRWLARIGCTWNGFAGQGLVEYALILLLVAAVAVGMLATFGSAVSSALNSAVLVFP